MEIRKIETHEESEKKRKRNTLMLSIIMIGILLFSTAGYFTFKGNEDGGSETKYENPTSTGDYWVLNYGGAKLRFSSSPESAKNVSILFSKTMEDYYGKTIYVASESELTSDEIISTLGRFTARTQKACYGNCTKNLPERKCGLNETMIVVGANSIDLTEKGKVYEANNCVFIEGGIIQVDAFLYRLFGVI